MAAGAMRERLPAGDSNIQGTHASSTRFACIGKAADGAALLVSHGGTVDLTPAAERLQTLLHRSLDILLPPTCTFCGGEAELRRLGLCVACARGLRAGVPAASCPGCAMPRPAAGRGAAERRQGNGDATPASVEQPLGEGDAASDGTAVRECPHCAGQRFRFSRAVALGLYRGQLREAVIAAKQSAHLPLAVSLGRLTAEAIAAQLDTCRPELVTAVPSYWKRRLRRRGTPAEALAETIAAELNIRHGTLLKCTRQTEKQGTLSPERRRTNVRGAFALKTGYVLGAAPWSGRGRHVLLIDDVLTTGATADAAAAALISGGAARVSLAVVARAVG